MIWLGRAATTAVLAVAVALGFAAPGPRAGAAGAVDVPSNIDATGARDVTAELNAFFAGLADGTTVRFARDAHYDVEGILFLSGKRSITIEGQGATIEAKTDGAGVAVPRPSYRGQWPRSRAHVVVEDTSGLTVRDLTVRGPNASGAYRPALEAQAAFVIKASSGVTFDRVALRDTYGDGAYIVGSSSAIRLRDCTLDHNGRQGVAVVAGENITVERCAIRNTGRSAVDLEPGFGPAGNVRVQDNEISDVGNLMLAAGGGGNGVTDVWFQRNRVHGGRGVSVYAGNDRFLRTGIHVLDNVGDGTSAGLDGALMTFVRFDGVEVRGNTQRVGSGVVPVELVHSCHATVKGNDFGAGPTTPTATGDCTAPGLAPPRAVRLPTSRPADRGTRPATSVPSTQPKPIVVTRVEHDGTSPIAIAGAFAAGAVVGAAGVYLALRTRRNRGAAPEEPEPESEPEEESDDHG